MGDVRSLDHGNTALPFPLSGPRTTFCRLANAVEDGDRFEAERHRARLAELGFLVTEDAVGEPALALFAGLIRARADGDVKAALDLRRRLLAAGWSVAPTREPVAGGGQH